MTRNQALALPHTIQKWLNFSRGSSYNKNIFSHQKQISHFAAKLINLTFANCLLYDRTHHFFRPNCCEETKK